MSKKGKEPLPVAHVTPADSGNAIKWGHKHGEAAFVQWLAKSDTRMEDPVARQFFGEMFRDALMVGFLYGIDHERKQTKKPKGSIVH